MYFQAINLCKKFPKKEIRFSMSAEKNTLTCILGPSGSGKSTILNLISGFEKNDDINSSIILDGQEIKNLLPGKRNIGMVFQSGALFEHLNVVDNVAFGLISNGVPKKKAREQASKFLKEFDLENFEKRNVLTLSGGERQRVAVARTLIVKPKLILFDEPLSALDANLRKKLAVQIKAWHQTFGFTGIMVTHDENEAIKIADKIIKIS